MTSPCGIHGRANRTPESLRERSELTESSDDAKLGRRVLPKMRSERNKEPEQDKGGGGEGGGGGGEEGETG